MFNNWESWVVASIVLVALVWGVSELWKLLNRFARMLGYGKQLEEPTCDNPDGTQCCGCPSAGDCKPQSLKNFDTKD